MYGPTKVRQQHIIFSRGRPPTPNDVYLQWSGENKRIQCDMVDGVEINFLKCKPHNAIFFIEVTLCSLFVLKIRKDKTLFGYAIVLLTKNVWFMLS